MRASTLETSYLILLLLLSTPMAKAEVARPLCTSIFSTNSELRIQKKIQIDLNVVTQAPKAEEFQKTLSEIDQLLGPLAIPEKVEVSVGKNLIFSGFNFSNFKIFVGLKQDRARNSHPRLNQFTLAHEYGHAIFEENLLRDSPEFKLFRENLLKAGPGMWPSQGMIINNAYHEFFADAMALIWSRDPKVMSKLLPPKEIQQYSSADLARRDFTSGRNHQSRQNWARLDVQHNEYLVLLPARWELWNITKNKIKSENYRKTLAGKIFAILKSEVVDLLAQEALSPTPATLQDIQMRNQRLIEAFRRELQ